MRKICDFRGKFDQHLSLFRGTVKPKFQTGPEYWFLWGSFEKNNVEKNVTFSLFETSVNGNVTFAPGVCISGVSLYQRMPNRPTYIEISKVLRPYNNVQLFDISKIINRFLPRPPETKLLACIRLHHSGGLFLNFLWLPSQMFTCVRQIRFDFVENYLKMFIFVNIYNSKSVAIMSKEF